MPQLKPRQPVPTLSVPTLKGRTFELSAQKPEHFTLIVVYRGLHCPVCRKYMKELADLVPEFAARGNTVLGLSTDDEHRARQSYEQWQPTDCSLDMACRSRWYAIGDYSFLPASQARKSRTILPNQACSW